MEQVSSRFPSESQSDSGRMMKNHVEKGGRFLAWTPFLPLVMLFVILYLIPLGRTVYLSFGGGETTLDYYRQFFSTPVYVKVLRFTVTMSLLVAVISVIVGFGIAYVLATSGRIVRNVMFVAVLVPWLVTELVRNFSWLVILRGNGLLSQLQEVVGLGSDPIVTSGTSGAVLIGLVYVELPLAVLPLYAVMRRLDLSLMNVAASLGANIWRRTVHVLLPMSVHGVMTAWTLVFLVTLGHFVTPMILGGDRDLFMANLIDVQVSRLVNWEFGSVLAVVLALSGLLVVAATGRFVRFDWLVDE